MAVDALCYLLDDVLVKADRAAMAVSLGARTPFLDHRVTGFVRRSRSAEEGVRDPTGIAAAGPTRGMGGSAAGRAAIARGRVLRSGADPAIVERALEHA